jgi:hypothetical protein
MRAQSEPVTLRGYRRFLVDTSFLQINTFLLELRRGKNIQKAPCSLVWLPVHSVTVVLLVMSVVVASWHRLLG